MKFIIALQLPDNFDPLAPENEETFPEIMALNQEIETAGVGVLAAGLEPAFKAKTVRRQPDGNVLVTDGPYLDTKEHIGGFWVLELESMEVALEWARKGAKACRYPIEVRSFNPPPPAYLELVQATQSAN